MTVREWIRESTTRLSLAGIEAANLEAQLLAGHVLLVGRPWLMAHPEEPFPELAGESLLSRRLNHEPLAYILGKREFYGRVFEVGPGVLIPRQETEVLVDAALRNIRELRLEKPRVLDLGTGSGCIAITLKLEEPGLEVTASDISVRALAIAERNSSTLGADILFVNSDGFEQFSDERFEVIVTNPPYIGFEEALAEELTSFEPHEALYSGSSGFEFYERLAHESHQVLKLGGLILMEVGYLQAARVVQLFTSNDWTHICTDTDLSGVARVVVCSCNIKPEDTKRSSDDT